MTTYHQVMSELLKALGFDAMSKAVLTETDNDRISTYHRFILKNSPKATKERTAALLKQAVAV